MPLSPCRATQFAHLFCCIKGAPLALDHKGISGPWYLGLRVAFGNHLSEVWVVSAPTSPISYLLPTCQQSTVPGWLFLIPLLGFVSELNWACFSARNCPVPFGVTWWPHIPTSVSLVYVQRHSTSLPHSPTAADFIGSSDSALMWGPAVVVAHLPSTVGNMLTICRSRLGS